MFRSMVRIAALSAAVALVLALPATAQYLPAGEDRWVTPNDGSTYFTFPAGDVESLCGAPVDFGWNRTVRLTGVPEPGYDWDTVVKRLNDADLSQDYAEVAITVSRLVFKSLETMETPCGRVNWYVKALDNQPVTKMVIVNKTGRGGYFKANISVRVAFEATDANGSHLGLLYYTFDLPDKSGVPWSFDSFGNFRPGIDEGDNCEQVLRDKATTLPARHTYYIEQLIAQGKCDGRPQ